MKSKNVCRASWEVIKNNVNNISNKNDIKSINQNDINYTKPSDISELFNDYFINLTTQTRNNIKANNVTDQMYIENTTNTMFLMPCDEMEVIKIINSLKNTN